MLLVLRRHGERSARARRMFMSKYCKWVTALAPAPGSTTALAPECTASFHACIVRAVHPHCQKRMLETRWAWDQPVEQAPALRCGVCHASYSNAEAVAVRRLSILGALWCTCMAGVGVMWWSANTVLDRGSNGDPPLNYALTSWWGYQAGHLTWWRIVGLAYLAISFGMACISLAWLVLDQIGAHPLGRTEPLCVQRFVVHVHEPRGCRHGIARLCSAFRQRSKRGWLSPEILL